MTTLFPNYMRQNEISLQFSTQSVLEKDVFQSALVPNTGRKNGFSHIANVEQMLRLRTFA